MPVREKVKRLFKSSSSRSDSGLSKTDSSSSRERWPSNVYKPGEPMPRLKYRAIPKKEHTEKLESFSFADAWRKKSFQSTYSPHGTRAPSRNPSLFSRRSRKSVSGRSTDGRTASVVSNGTTRSDVAVNRMKTQPEAEGDDDITNVGLSRVQSKEQTPLTRPRTAEDDETNGVVTNGVLNGVPNGLYRAGTAADHQPFSEHDLALAMKRSHLGVPAGGA